MVPLILLKRSLLLKKCDDICAAGGNLVSAHRTDVHGFAATCCLNHGVEALGGAEEDLGLLDVVFLLRLQSRLHVLLFPGLQELQLLRCWRTD